MTQLKKSTLFYYSLTEMPVMMGFFPALVFIPRFYASDVGVPLALVGTYILVARIVDVFTDPLMGFISDRVPTRWGRRKPWVVLSVPVMMTAIYMLFMPPDGAGGTHMLIWMLVLGLGQTMVIIPYWSWGAELSTDYNERSRVTGWRAQAGIVGNPRIFEYYGRYKGAGTRIKAGHYSVDMAWTPRQLLEKLEKGTLPPQVKVTIPEGWNRWQVADQQDAF